MVTNFCRIVIARNEAIQIFLTQIGCFVVPPYNDEVIIPHIISISGLLRSAYNDEPRNPVIASTGHGKNPLQKRVMT